MNNTNTTTSNPFAMGTVNLNTGASTPAQSTNTLNSFNQAMVAPIQPATIPNSQSITTFSTQPITLPVQTPTQPAPILNPYQNIIDQTATTQTEAQKKEASVSQLMYDLAPKLEGKSAATIEAEKQAGVLDKTKAYNTLNSKVNMLDAEINQDDIKLAQGLQNIEDKPIAMEFITGQQQSVSRNAALARALKTAEKGVLIAQAQAALGDIELAKATAKQAVETKYAPYKEALDTYKLQLEALQPLLNSDEKKQAREQEIKTNLAMKEVDKKQKNEESVTQMVIQAGAQGAPQSLVEKARMAKTPAEAVSILGAYAGDYWGTKIKMAQYSKLLNENARIASEISTAGVGTGSTVGATDQAKFLLDTIAKAKVKADAAGRSAGRRTAESWLVGSTDYTNLESQVRTLKTNLLTLATDPNIKKFFGPQMTENDVKNMQSAATTLDTELQNPADLRAELARAEAIFKKFAPDYKPAPINVESWASGLGAVLNAANNNNYGYVDNQ